MEENALKSGIALQRSSSLVLILDTPKGRGVFARERISAGELIETCPVLVIPKQDDDEHVKHTILYHYTYNWPGVDNDGKSITTQAVIFGLGSMFNHSMNQNVGWDRDISRLVVTYKAIRDIEIGEELCISYGSRLTFKDAEFHEHMEEEYPRLDSIDL